MRYAEVIGDPIAQSKSPILHKHWLEELNLPGDYRQTHVPAGSLTSFLRQRHEDPDWLGCNVTIPHKEKAAALVDKIDTDIGAVNCVLPQGRSLIGYNTDIDGVAEALRSADMKGGKAVIIGAGGGARAVLAHLLNCGVESLTILVRNPDRAVGLRPLLGHHQSTFLPFDRAAEAVVGAGLIVNASPLGMVGAMPMPRPMLDALAGHAAGAIFFDMVTTPETTEFLAVGKLQGARTVDGLTMLIAQAARAFALFFGVPAPKPDQKLRELLTAGTQDLA